MNRKKKFKKVRKKVDFSNKSDYNIREDKRKEKTKMFKKFTKKEWEEATGMEVTMISLKDEDVVAVYEKMSEDGGCFVGCKYKDGTYSVVGAGIDRFVSYADMFRIVMAG